MLLILVTFFMLAEKLFYVFLLFCICVTSCLLRHQMQVDSLRGEVQNGETQCAEYATRIELMKQAIIDCNAEKDSIVQNREKAVR